MPLHNLPTLYRAQVVNRPSKTIKSPYVADILLEDGTQALCHTPGLGCSGLVSTGKYIYVSKAANANAKNSLHSTSIGNSRSRRHLLYWHSPNGKPGHSC